jgi:hypothetical protein
MQAKPVYCHNIIAGIGQYFNKNLSILRYIYEIHSFPLPRPFSFGNLLEINCFFRHFPLLFGENFWKKVFTFGGK